MNNLAISKIPAMDNVAIEKVRRLEELALRLPQVEIPTAHVIHAGMYARTIMIPAGILLTGALIKIATLLIIQGDVTAYIGDQTLELQGYNVLPAAANRKQAFVAKTDTFLTMIFPSKATCVRDAEEEFTDEAEALISRKALNNITITEG